MLAQLLNQMDEHLANKPFKRRWWSKRWIVHMTIQPPLSKHYPLWKRSKEELRLLRLFNLSPEELGRKIERYWKKPRWRRWLSSFGMKKKIDVWHYYQWCLAYRAIRPLQLNQNMALKVNGKSLATNQLALALHQSTVKFERYLEKRTRHSNWPARQGLQEINHYKQHLKKTFSKTLRKILKRIASEKERCYLKEQAEREYQQVEKLMLRYFIQWMNYFYPKEQSAPAVELGVDAIEEQIQADLVPVSCAAGQTAASSSLSQLPREMNQQQPRIGSIYVVKEWIQTQREQLALRLEEDSLPKVEDLLAGSLNEIKEMTELYLNCFGELFDNIPRKKEVKEVYESLLKHLDDLAFRLKMLLQGGLRLFHPDRVLSLTRSEAMRVLITRYSQIYLDQSKHYFTRIQDYYQRFDALQRRALGANGYDFTERFEVIEHSLNEIKKAFKEIREQMQEAEKRWANRVPIEVLESRLEKIQAESEAKLEKIQAESEVKLEKIQTERMQDKTELEKVRAESEAKLKELQVNMNKMMGFFNMSPQATNQSSAPAQNVADNNTNPLFLNGS